MDLSYNNILNFCNLNIKTNNEKSCITCNNFSALGGGENKILSMCKIGRKLWSKTCFDYQTIEK